MRQGEQDEMINTNMLSDEEKLKLKEYQETKEEYKDKSRYININTITSVINNRVRFEIKNNEIEVTKEATELFKDFGKKRSINTKMIPCCIPYSFKGTVAYNSKKSGYILIYISYKYVINKINYSYEMLVKYLKKKASINQLKLNNITITTPNYEDTLKKTITNLDNYDNPPNWWVPYESYLQSYREYLIEQDQNNYSIQEQIEKEFKIEVLEKIIPTRKDSGLISYYIKPRLPFNSSIYIIKEWNIRIEPRDIDEYQINNRIKAITCAQSYLWMQNKMIKSYKIMKKNYLKFDSKSLINGNTAYAELVKYNNRRKQLLNSDSSEYTTYDKIINKKDLSKYRTNSIQYLKKPIKIGGDKWGNVKVKLLAPGATKQRFKKRSAFLYKNEEEEREEDKKFNLVNINLKGSTEETNSHKYSINEYSFIGLKPISNKLLLESNVIKYNLYSIYFEFIMEIEKDSIEDLFDFSASVSVYLNSMGSYKRLENESDEEYKKRTTVQSNRPMDYQSFIQASSNFEKEEKSNTLLGSQIFSISKFEKQKESKASFYIAKATMVTSLKSCIVKHIDKITVLVDTNCDAKMKIISCIKYKLFQSYFQIKTEDSQIRITNYQDI